MSTLIALRGKGRIGKSTTIKLLRDILLNTYFGVIDEIQYRSGGDIFSIFKLKGKIIGIASSGDLSEIVEANLDEFIKNNCDIAVCACRSYGQTVTAIEFNTSFNHIFISKTIGISKLDQDSANFTDANEILSIINKLI